MILKVDYINAAKVVVEEDACYSSVFSKNIDILTSLSKYLKKLMR